MTSSRGSRTRSRAWRRPPLPLAPLGRTPSTSCAPTGGTLRLRLAGFGLDTDHSRTAVIEVRGASRFFAVLNPATHRFLSAELTPHLRALATREGIALSAAAIARLPANQKRLFGIGLNPADLRSLDRFPNLSSVNLHRSPKAVTLPTLQTLTKLPKLRSLVLHAGHVDAVMLTHLAEKARLQELFLIGDDVDWAGLEVAPIKTPIDGACATILARMTSLSELWIVGAVLSDVDIAALAGLPKLRSLSLAHSLLFDGSGFAAFRDHETLTFLHLDGCSDCRKLASLRSRRSPR